MGTRWLVLAGAILALNAPALDLLALKLSTSGMLPGPSLPFMTRTAGEYDYVVLHDLYVRISPAFVGHAGICLAPLLGAFARLRRSRALRILTPAAYLAATFYLVIRCIVAPAEELGLLEALAAFVSVVGVFVLAAQAAAAVREGTPAATARILIGLVLILQGLAEWSFWRFDPWLLGTWAAVAGGALIVVGEGKALWEPVPS